MFGGNAWRVHGWSLAAALAVVACEPRDGVAAARGGGGPSAQTAEPAITKAGDGTTGREPVVEATGRRTPPEGWIDLAVEEPAIQLHVGYHGEESFAGERLPGYGVPGAWLREEAGRSLIEVQHELAQEGLGLRVFDAYRPRRATLAMVAWAERTGQTRLLDEGYIARRSGHNHANTVDLTLVRLTDGEPLDMGTPWDDFSTASHTARAEGDAAKNRARLVSVMAQHGWQNYEREWWHFHHTRTKPGRARDVPYACFEVGEGEWNAPRGWEQPGSTTPLAPPRPDGWRDACDDEPAPSGG